MTSNVSEISHDVRGTLVRVRRSGSGPTVLLLGSGIDSAPEDLLAEAISRSADVVRIDYPWGREDELPAWLDDIEDLALFIQTVVEKLDLSQVHLVGLSLGGWVGAEMAIRNTTRLASLCLVGMPGIHVPYVQRTDIFMLPEAAATEALYEAPAEAASAVERMRAIPEPDRIRNQTGVARVAWRPRWHDPRLDKWLDRIDVPTTIVWGEKDRFTPLSFGQKLHGLIPNAEFIVLEGCGHLPHVEKKDELVAIIQKHIAGK